MTGDYVFCASNTGAPIERTGHLLCDGATHPVTTATRALATLLGYGPEATDFDVPDLVGAVLVGTRPDLDDVGDVGDGVLKMSDLPIANSAAGGNNPEAAGAFFAQGEAYGIPPATPTGQTTAPLPPHVKCFIFIEL